MNHRGVNTIYSSMIHFNIVTYSIFIKHYYLLMNQSPMRAFIVLMSVILLPLTASADAVEIDGIWYHLVNKSKTAEVTRNPNVGANIGCYSGDIIIPPKVTYESVEYDVTIIGDNAFYQSSGLTTIDIPNSVISIGNDAFYNCTGLISLILPNSLSSIGNYTFAFCTGLTSLTIPNSVTSIGNNAFDSCSGLTSLTLSNRITSISLMMLRNCAGLKFIDIPYGITSIDNGAFSGCTSLTSIEIPNTITSMGIYAFEGCSKITTVKLSNSLANIDQYTFKDCTSLTTITIPNSVKRIYREAFSGCSSLTTVTIGTGIKNLYSNSFTNCGELSNVYCFAESVPTTVSDVFDNSYVNLANLHVPASSVSAYSSSAPWSGFGEIVPITSEDITIGDLGIGTFCGSNPLDLSGTEDVKAYVVSSYESATGQVTLTRTYYIPPFTGVVVKGSKGTHTIPAGVGQPVFPNMMKGVTTNTALNKVNGDYTNYVLANKGGNLGFYAVSDGSTLGAGKAYLPLPTADLPTAAREFTLIFDDGETTEIMKVASQEKASQGYYDLQGRRVANPTSGLYIVNGKKVIIK